MPAAAAVGAPIYTMRGFIFVLLMMVPLYAQISALSPVLIGRFFD